MNLSIVTAVCGKNEVTEEWINTTITRCEGNNELVIVNNGSSKEENKQLGEFVHSHPVTSKWRTLLEYYDKPLGTTKAFDCGASISCGDVIAMIHNDLEIKIPGWDKLLLEYAAQLNPCGVMGFVGAKRLGDYSIYKAPYFLAQMARFDVYSSQDDAEKHGKKVSGTPVNVAVLDGMALIIKRYVYRMIGGLDTNYIHHMYDNDLCLSAMSARFMNWVLPIEVHHRGGMTSCGTEYDLWVRNELGLDGDGEVHTNSHEYFYDKWRGKLPMEVS